jgi:hypothetical protein
MQKPNNQQVKANHSLNKLIISITVVVVFVGLMATVIVYLLKAQPIAQGTAMEGFARQFQQSVETSHWQWQAQGRPQRIILLHYNAQGKERARMPVRMEHTGRPWVEKNGKGCEKLWLNMLYEPTQADGFKVISEYYPPQGKNKDKEFGFCRYRLSQGPSFDYDLLNGKVTFNNKD